MKGHYVKAYLFIINIIYVFTLYLPSKVPY